MTRVRTGRAAGRGGAGSPGAAARPAPGECPAGRRHLKGLRAGEEACGGVTGARSELEFKSGSDRTGEGAMASSGPLVPPLLLLLVLLAGAARAGLHFRPGRGCYRPLRGDRLTQLGRRSGRLGLGGSAHLPGLCALCCLGNPAASLGCQQPGRPASLDLCGSGPAPRLWKRPLSLVWGWTGLTRAGSKPISPTCIWGVAGRSSLVPALGVGVGGCPAS